MLKALSNKLKLDCTAKGHLHSHGFMYYYPAVRRRDGSLWEMRNIGIFGNFFEAKVAAHKIVELTGMMIVWRALCIISIIVNVLQIIF